MANPSLVNSTPDHLFTNVNTVKGSILVADNTALVGQSPLAISKFAALNPGADGQVLTTDSTQTLGVKWASGTSGPASSLSPGANINGVLFTGASNIVVPAAAGTLTGTTLAAAVVTSSLTSVGVLAAPAVGSYLKASLPTATSVGQVIYVSNATGAHVTGSLCFSNATGAANWIDVTTGVAVA